MTLIPSHREHLASFRVPLELLEAAGVCSVTDSKAREICGINGRNNDDFAGIMFPYRHPTTGRTRGHRIRLDTPNGSGKYYMEQCCRDLFFPPGVEQVLTDTSVPVIFVESEKAALALVAFSIRTGKKILSVATGGIDAWKRFDGYVPRSDGRRRKHTGPSPSLDLIIFPGRDVVIFSDANVSQRIELQISRHEFAKELRKRGARVHCADVPKIEGVNGPDDLLAHCDDKTVFEILGAAEPEKTPEPERLGKEDTSNAARFARNFGENVRYWHGRNKWMVFTGTHWKEDELASVVEMAKETARSIYIEAAEEKDEEKAKSLAGWATTSLQKQKVLAMLDLAKSLPELAVSTETFDSDPYLLNFTNGTVDIRTGELREHQRENYITKLVNCDYNPDATAPRWEKFINQTLGADLADWIQIAVGYSLTGETREKCLFILQGPTDTGKTTFLETNRTVFHDYSAVLQIDTLMHRKGRDNNTDADLADLRGARFVTTSETEEGQRLNEALVKRLTQGMGELKTARKYENPITFCETHKIWMDCNHQPMLYGTDDAIWNRLLPIPCNHKLADGEKDRQLKEKLLEEVEGIAAWAVKGAMKWYALGLNRPEIIERERLEWRSRVDILGQWLAENCRTDDPEETEGAQELYADYSNYARSQGHYPMSSTTFGTRMGERGFTKRPSGETRRIAYRRIRLRNFVEKLGG